MEELSSGLILISTLSLTLAFLTGGVLLKRLSPVIRLCWVYIAGISIIEIISYACIEMGLRNLWLLDYYVINEYITIGLAYTTVFISLGALKRKNASLLFVVGFAILCFLRMGYFLFPQTNLNWTLCSNTFVHLSLVSASGYYLFKTMTAPQKTSDKPLFLISAAIFCFYSSSYISDLIFEKIVSASFIDIGIVWGINLGLTIIFYSVLTYSFILDSKIIKI